MRPVLLNRKVHSWLSLVIALPVLVIVVSGLLLHLKKDLAWIQPPERQGQGGSPAVSMDAILAAARGVPEAGIRGWEDVRRVDLRPGKGLLKVIGKGGWEIQVDAASGEVLQSAYRRSDLLEALHDGSYFHDAVKRWVFLPAGGALLILWITGLVLFFRPFFARRRRTRDAVA
jgi:uncharacterized iron-regulated membrane protein